MPAKRYNVDTATAVIKEVIDTYKGNTLAFDIALAMREYYWDLFGKKELIKRVFELKADHDSKEIAEKCEISQTTVWKILNHEYI